MKKYQFIALLAVLSGIGSLLLSIVHTIDKSLMMNQINIKIIEGYKLFGFTLIFFGLVWGIVMEVLDKK
jgi:hypothetical protein